MGTVITNEIPAPLDTPEERRRMGLDLVDALAEVHAVDWRACGLEGFGKPTGYLERQLRRFNGLWEHNKTRELPRVQEVRRLARREHARVARRRRSCTATTGSATRWSPTTPPARVIAIFDWELSTIGDPLADLGYLTVTWVQPGDPEDTMFSSLSRGHAARGLPDARRADRPLRGAHRAARCRPALVPGARALEGGRVHGGQLQALARRHHRRPVPEAVRRGRAAARRGRIRDQPCRLRTERCSGLLVDYGGVLTTNVWESFRAFCEAEGLDRDEVKKALPRATRRRCALLRRLEAGELTEETFAPLFGPLLGMREDRYEGLVDRLFAGMQPEQAMIDALRARPRGRA